MAVVRLVGESGVMENMTRDDALLILNDHIGQEVAVHVHLYRSGQEEAVLMGADGPLSHWRSQERPPDWMPAARKDLTTYTGLYMVGNADFDVTGCRDARLLEHDAWMLEPGEKLHGLAFTLAGDDEEGVEMQVIWAIQRADERERGA